LIFGTLLMTSAYGLLPTDFRFSRALIILTTIWTLFLTVGVRVFLHFLKHKNLNVGASPEQNLAIVGSPEEGEKVMKLLQQAGVQKKLIGLVSAGETSDRKTYLGSLPVLDDLVHIFRIDEIIFCSSDVSQQQIMHWMTELGPKVNFKILPQKSNSIIGSNSKNTQGELYTVDIQFNIASPMNRRNKRGFDVLTSLVILPILPVLIFIVKNGFSFLQNWFSVLLGAKTWVGYHSDFQNENLPTIRQGVLNPTHNLKIKIEDEATIQRLNFLYARDYEPERDFEIFRKGFKLLGADYQPVELD